MIAIATARFNRAPALDATSSALSLFLALLNDIIRSAENVEMTLEALRCIGKLSRFHGKAQLPQFEQLLPAIVGSGLGSEHGDIKNESVNCLLSMLYVSYTWRD
jgi:hypothetical protein